ncbi:copper amine oxidase N-terminal domain-containing protein [Paenibacillus senegalimassiliensis]|uniref:copper amine oxidase N-terminal domain-containing protein n=1 Tax=Paenibacillus senegalimassiliensis TaxID=1737426 RepID=UPI00073F7A4C|nr:copper amine oxidase N-terminal domain-containing protein [Paenibacillus senegalimassiliensis]
MKNHKLLLALCSVIVLLGLIAPAVSANKVTVNVQVDDKDLKFPDAQPFYENNRVLVPLRFVSEALGAKVDYKKESVGNQKERIVYVKLDGKTVQMPIDSVSASVDGVIVKLDVPARDQESRVFVPLRFVSEALGAEVEWNQSKLLVSIYTEAETGEPDPIAGHDNMYNTDFKWKDGQNNLAEQLFVNNMKTENGKLTFKMPNGAMGYAGNTEFVTGKSYSFDLGKGMITFAKVYPEQGEQEVYTISLDSSANEDLKALFNGVKDAIVIGDKGAAAPLAEVLKLAQQLKN